MHNSKAHSGDSDTDGPRTLAEIVDINYYIIMILDVNLKRHSKKAFKQIPIKKEEWNFDLLTDLLLGRIGIPN